MNPLIPYIRQAGEQACSDSLERRKAGDPEYQRSLRKCQSLFEQICVKYCPDNKRPPVSAAKRVPVPFSVQSGGDSSKWMGTIFSQPSTTLHSMVVVYTVRVLYHKTGAGKNLFRFSFGNNRAFTVRRTD